MLNRLELRENKLKFHVALRPSVPVERYRIFSSSFFPSHSISIVYEVLIEIKKNLSLLSSQVSLVMDPAHLITPPRAHPSGISSNESIHSRNILNETWFMVIMAIVLVSLLVFAAFTLRFLYRRRKNLSKGLQHHLSGE